MTTSRGYIYESLKDTSRPDHSVPFLSSLRDEELGVFLHHKPKKATFIGSVSNLSCTIVGAGIMSLPYAMKLLGVIPGFLLTIFAAYLTEASIELIIRFSKEAGASSYADLMENAFGTWGKILLQASVIINNVGVLIIYLIIIEDVVSGSTSSGVHYSGVLEEWFGEHWWTGRAFVLLFLTCLIFIPASWLKDIGSLSAMSAIAVALAVAFIIIVVGITVYKLIQGSIDQPAWFPSITDFSSFCTLFTAMPVLICAYLCHYNVHSIQNELQDPSQMRSVVKTSLSLCVSIYVTTGLFGFLLFGDSTASDVLSNFDTDLGVPYSSVLNDLVRACYAGHIMLIFPIIFYPLRLNFDGLLFPKAQRALELDIIRFAFVTLGLIAIILVGAIFVPSIWVAFEFTGATAGAMLLFIFPAAVALRDSQGIATRKDKIMSVTFIVIAVFADVVAIYSDASSLVSS